jgi:hypothetical protein
MRLRARCWEVWMPGQEMAERWYVRGIVLEGFNDLLIKDATLLLIII